MQRNMTQNDMIPAMITNVGSDGVTCMTQSGKMTITFELSGFDEPPKVNEVWLIQRIASNKWKLWNRVRSGDINVMRYSIRLDAADCVGKERAVVDDIASAGFDEVLLTVAKDGMVYWDSEAAQSYGLGKNPVLKQLLDRFRHRNVAVTLAVSGELWSDTTNEAYAPYQQATASGERSRMYSPSGAMEAITALIDELRLMHGADAYGFCLDGIGLAGLRYDRNPTADRNFFARNRVMPNERYVVGGVDDDYLLWRSFLSEEQRALCSSIKSKIGQTALTAIVPDYAYCLVDSEGAGYARSGIASDFGTYGWAYVGMPMKYQKSADEQSELRSFEALVAVCSRLGEACKPLYVLDIPDITQPFGMFSVLAKYNASQVVVGDYADYRLLSDEKVIELWSAMDKYRISERNSSDYNGMAMSMRSLQAANWQSEANVAYMEAWYSMASLMIDKTSNRMRVLFDDDLKHEDKYERNAATCLFMVSNMEDDAVSVVDKIIEGGGKYVCLVGRCGYYVDDTTEQRELPFIGLFGESATTVREYIYSVTLDGGIVSNYSRSFYIGLGATGLKTVMRKGRATGYDQVQNADGVVNVEVNAPVLVRDRHVYMAIDVAVESMLTELASELFVYSVSRDA